MKRAIVTVSLVLAALAAPAPALADGPPNGGAAAPKGKLEVTIDRAKVDLEGHRLEVKMNHAAEKVRLKVLGDTGEVLAELEQPFGGAAPGTALVVAWEPKSAAAVARIEVWGHDTDGFYAGVAVVPWSVKVPHEEVNFENDSDAIRASEVPKLEASLKAVLVAAASHKELGNVALFVAGHTDTVGGAEHNLGLSRRRAKAIAGWFRQHGLRIPVAFEGFGEHSPLVKTADEVAEPKNRRVDYILSLEPPRLPSGPVAFAWRSL
jgi:outer membrane protein OmpA-like peptidoglycan-associated protein